jgi:hypothetical protein
MRGGIGRSARLLVVLALWCGLGGGRAASAAETEPVKGTTKGLLVADPKWSAGAQLGNGGSTGLVVQRLGPGEGAVNVGLGLEHGELALTADWIALMDEDFQRFLVSPAGGYNVTRGRLTPYFGGGLLVGSGYAVRLPMGVQYTMLKDPFNFYAGGALMIGKFRSDDDLELEFWIQIGVRLLL